MIKIATVGLQVIANKFFEKVCVDNDGQLGLVSILKNKRDAELDARKKIFYNELIADVEDITTSIIIAKPERLQERAKYYTANFSGILGKEFRKFLKNSCFFYGTYQKWGAYELAKDLGVNVCPYCNRQYTFTLSTSAGNTRPQFDHFIDRATFPYLSLSFYNLVPSCSICNTSLKGTKKFSLKTHIHPYIEGFAEDACFTILPKSIDFINGVSDSYKIKIDVKAADKEKAARIKKNIEVFKLVELYNMHKDAVDELIIKSRIYNKAYVDSLFSDFGGTLFASVDDVRRLIISNYIDPADQGKRVLSKLSSDIALELKIAF